MHVSRSHADGLFPSSQRYCFDKIAKSQQSLFLLCNKSRLRPQSKFMAPLTELESSSAMLTVNTVGSCAELLEMSNVCSLQATQPARLSLDPVAFRRAQCIGTISLAMRVIWPLRGCDGVAMGVRLYAISTTVTGVRPRSNVQFNPLCVICMSMLVRAQLAAFRESSTSLSRQHPDKVSESVSKALGHVATDQSTRTHSLPSLLLRRRTLKHSVV